MTAMGRAEAEAVEARFAQCIDVSRPHSLLTVDPRRSGNLVFKYEDTGEFVRVPNVWYNQTFQVRVSAVLWDADCAEEWAARMLARPPLGLSPAAVSNIAARYRARATQIRGEAQRMAREGSDTHPVAAARMQLDYGANVA